MDVINLHEKSNKPNMLIFFTEVSTLHTLSGEGQHWFLLKGTLEYKHCKMLESST